MRWLVGCSLRFRYLVVGLAAGLMFFGVQVLGHEKLDVFPEFAPVSVEIQTTAWATRFSEQVESLKYGPARGARAPGATTQSYSEPELSPSTCTPVRNERAARQQLVQSGWGRRRRCRPARPAADVLRSSRN
jgi:hypothetical protein